MEKRRDMPQPPPLQSKIPHRKSALLSKMNIKLKTSSVVSTSPWDVKEIKLLRGENMPEIHFRMREERISKLQNASK